MYRVETPIAVPTSRARRAPWARDQGLQEGAGAGHHDRDPVPLAVGLHLGEQRIGVGVDALYVVAYVLGDNHRARTLPTGATERGAHRG